jgi:PAS domain S-box-containing protein
VAIILTAAALVFAIYFTESNLQWAAFLTGILVAAVLAEAVRLSRSEWIVMRRTAQVSSLKDKLEHATLLYKRNEQKIAADKGRLQLIDETLPTMVAQIDVDGICSYHNRAFRDWLHSRTEQINGRHFREIIGTKAYAEIATAVRQSLDGQTVRYERMQQMLNGPVYRLSVEHVPQFDSTGKVTGFYFLADDITARSDLHSTEKALIGNDSSMVANAIAPGQNVSADQEMYINSLSEQITGQKDAGKRIMAAVQKGEFHLYCQLISPLSVDSGEAEHYEILIRLKEEEEGMLPPGAFFPVAEKHGLMPYLDRWVVQHVLEWASSKNPKIPRRENSIFFINVATATIGDPEFPDFLEATLKEYGTQASILCFEVADSDLSTQGASVARFIQRVNQCGCNVALSGFGRDNVSFDLIRGFQVQFLKIDGSIILHILSDPVALAKVVSIDRVAKKIGVKTVAELVESEELIVKLREVGVDFAQGFGISRPRSLAE